MQGLIGIAFFAALAYYGYQFAFGDGDSYTLYRASPADPSMRIHMATFDADDGAAVGSAANR